ncbi:WecB/TagA/CpsF family glycosyltransferase [Flavobacterium saccharophilum]|uniref:N-acetylglucosaminyldiphosphoundecaprenol N-acetyl-beta-D-mannosaminyltransferase n=1 Tax=Flavobacterium saccharophilum TaxID=29534 RepID=A0A1M7GT05_9FLAO|nr:WecB/TagA/CpsF family glycosyltransferase [Flavobacterium saccharophilum]SHM19361.1 N-acetylglucosaminyldiphosphoundecaprenol N-acetyl-beta-D-mannosaminyltransferase [Flavobacterium saccharophilum]
MLKTACTVSLKDYNIYNAELLKYEINDKILINTINQYSYCIAEKDAEFKKALQNSDILLPDGVGIVSAIKFLYNKNIKKIAGADIHHYLLQDLDKKKGKCFYLGSSETTLNKIAERISKEFPNIQVDFFSPPYKTEFSEIENNEMIEKVNAFMPDVLFVGMTAPKQEKWSYKHKNMLDAKIICSIGAVFDFYAGTIIRPNKFWVDLSLEWFIRLLKEPKRMWRRYLYFGPVFIKLILKEKFKN